MDLVLVLFVLVTVSPSKVWAVSSVSFSVDGNQPSSVTVVEGQQKNFTCSVYGANLSLTVQWYREDGGRNSVGSLPGTTDQPQTSGRNTTIILHYSPDRQHSGQNIFCQANNSLNNQAVKSNMMNMRIERKPALPTLSGCSSGYIRLGEAGTCNCSTTDLGLPQGKLSWINPNGRTVAGPIAGIIQLLLGSIPSRFNGRNYTCRANNTHGNNDTTYSPQLAYGPENVSISGNRQVDADGQNMLALNCTSSSSSPAVTFSWRNSSDNSVIPGSSQRQQAQSVDGGNIYTSQLTITPQWYQDGDIIKCDARNSEISGQTVSGTVQLNLTYPPQNPPVISGYTGGTPLYEGDTFSLTCHVSGGKPLVTSVNVSCGSHQGGSTSQNGTSKTSQVSFQLSNSDHGQTCQCSAVHSTGRYSLTASVNLTVHYAPDVAMQNQTKHSDEQVTLACQADGRPANYTFYWFRQIWNGQEIRKLFVQQQNSGHYELPSVSYQDSGTYECVVENGIFGRNNKLNQTASAFLNVQATPIISKETVSVNIIGEEVSHPVTLYRTVFANPSVISYSWRKNEVLLPNNTASLSHTKVTIPVHGVEIQDDGYNITFMIEKFEKEDIALYSLEVCNSVGCLISNISLTAAGPPLTPLAFTVLNASTDMIWVSWKPGSKGGVYKQTFLLEYKLKAAQKWTVKSHEDPEDGGEIHAKIIGLQPGQVYVFRVMARNTRQGENTSPYTAEITGKTEDIATSSTIVGPAVGGGIGAAVLIIAVIAVVVFLQRRRTLYPVSLTLAIGTEKNHQRKEAKHVENGSTVAMHGSTHSEVFEVVSSHEKHDLYAGEGMMQNVLYGSNGPVGRATAPESVAVKLGKAGKTETKLKKTKEEKPEVFYGTVDKKGNTDEPKSGDVYGNLEMENVFVNIAFDGNDEGTYQNAGNNQEGPSGRNEDGLLYVDLGFGNKKSSPKIHKEEESTKYVAIDFTKKATPPEPEPEPEPELKPEQEQNWHQN